MTISFRYPSPLLHSLAEPQWLPRPREERESSLDILERQEHYRLEQLKQAVFLRGAEPIGIAGASEDVKAQHLAAMIAVNPPPDDALLLGMTPVDNTSNASAGASNGTGTATTAPCSSLSSKPSFWQQYRSQVPSLREMDRKKEQEEQRRKELEEREISKALYSYNHHRHPHSSLNVARAKNNDRSLEQQDDDDNNDHDDSVDEDDDDDLDMDTTMDMQQSSLQSSTTTSTILSPFAFAAITTSTPRSNHINNHVVVLTTSPISSQPRFVRRNAGPQAATTRTSTPSSTSGTGGGWGGLFSPATFGVGPSSSSFHSTSSPR